MFHTLPRNGGNDERRARFGSIVASPEQPGGWKAEKVKIVVEAETPGDSTTMFRVLLNGKVVGQHLTAVQAHNIVGDILERVVFPDAAAPVSG